MRRTYLIDYENTAEHGFDDILMEDGDELFCFFTKHSPKITLETLSHFQAGTMRFVSAPAGKDSLDAVLCSYLGYLIARTMRSEEDDREYVVISKDTIYDSPIEFWNKAYEKSIVRRRVPKALETPKPAPQATTGPQYLREAQEFVASYKGQQNVKMALYQKLTKQYGPTDGLAKYKKVRDIIWRKAS